jgi:gluconate kinase
MFVSSLSDSHIIVDIVALMSLQSADEVVSAFSAVQLNLRDLLSSKSEQLKTLVLSNSLILTVPRVASRIRTTYVVVQI